MADQDAPTRDATVPPWTTPQDVNGQPLYQGTIVEDRTQTAILTLTAGNLSTDYVAAATSSEVDARDVGLVLFWVEVNPGATAPTTMVFQVQKRRVTAGANYMDLNESLSGGTTTITLREYSYSPTNTINVKFALPVRTDGVNFVRIAVKGTGTLTDASVTVYATRSPLSV